MPHRASFDDHGSHVLPKKNGSPKPASYNGNRQSLSNMWGRTWHKVESWLPPVGRKRASSNDNNAMEYSKAEMEDKNANTLVTEAVCMDLCDAQEVKALKKNPFRKALPGLPRPLTFQRQNSERRDRLLPHKLDPEERRALSVDRRAVPKSPLAPSHSAPDVTTAYTSTEEVTAAAEEHHSVDAGPAQKQQDAPSDNASLKPTLSISTTMEREPSIASVRTYWDEEERAQIQAELESKWILNLSMNFKDRSDREKFFVTYAEAPNFWRRLTISCDYRDASADSLEADLKALHYQRDKSSRIYESIRDSLPDIQLYPTVTNLKLKTIDGRLHIHCSEDVNEIIRYPPFSVVRHLSSADCPVYKESEVSFQSHMAGFVYKVDVAGKVLVKKEIPGPESVDEFIYEANALHYLRGAKNVIGFEGLVVDNDGNVIKGLLINLAPQGALVDLIYDAKFSEGNGIPWSRRERWVKQIVNGLAEIHDAGFVQGDFTLSNIVLDAEENVFLIDINRRGCPIGWEPPELLPMIRSGQRIAMFIGVKTDLFQLGMVLWAIATGSDEPERQEKPLGPIMDPDVPVEYVRIIESCLQADPRKRPSAKELLGMFPPDYADGLPRLVAVKSHETVTPLAIQRGEKDYIDPEAAVSLEDIRPVVQQARMDDEAPSQTSELSSCPTFADGTTTSEFGLESHIVENVHVLDKSA